MRSKLDWRTGDYAPPKLTFNARCVLRHFPSDGSRKLLHISTTVVYPFQLVEITGPTASGMNAAHRHMVGQDYHQADYAPRRSAERGWRYSDNSISQFNFYEFHLKLYHYGPNWRSLQLEESLAAAVKQTSAMFIFSWTHSLCIGLCLLCLQDPFQSVSTVRDLPAAILSGRSLWGRWEARPQGQACRLRLELPLDAQWRLLDQQGRRRR